ncbi:hypothetical protein BJ508DRAFT_310285 [Ascobolus immersus RN42]|uniref:Uncharacterized protein n=1 Tax=Ascobolus immersus RN42 TaxID=1160509 RepID=A0A3N4I676_ASCIM|nr:hypothetical protein BJ508DRAFT_310285 [Ascobolus immersus RN42]
MEGEDYKCRKNWYPLRVEKIANPDISGIGVTTAFLVTALATFAFVLYGFWRNIILDELRNPTDKLVFDWLGSKSPPTARKQRTEMKAFYATIVAISDQQLVFGVAFLIAGLSDCTLSVYSLTNIEAIGWLILVVHLCTLVVLNMGGQSAKYSNKLKIVRLVFMGILLLLLITVTVLKSIVISCASDQSDEKLPDSSFSAYYLLQNPTDDASTAITDLLISSLLLVFTAVFYVDQILLFWKSTPSRNVARERVNKAPASFLVSARMLKIDLPPDYPYGAVRYLSEHQRFLSLQRTKKNNHDHYHSKKLSWPRAWAIFHLRTKLPRAMEESLVVCILALMYAVEQGITKVIRAWIGFTVDRNAMKDSIAWGPGQIIAIISLVSPVLAWFHSRYDTDHFSYPEHDEPVTTDSIKKGVKLDDHLQSSKRLNTKAQLDVDGIPIEADRHTSNCSEYESYDSLASKEVDLLSVSSFTKTPAFIYLKKKELFVRLFDLLIFFILQILAELDIGLAAMILLIYLLLKLAYTVICSLIQIAEDWTDLKMLKNTEGRRVKIRKQGHGLMAATHNVIGWMGGDLSLLVPNYESSMERLLEDYYEDSNDMVWRLRKRQSQEVKRLRDLSEVEEEAIRALSRDKSEVVAKELEILQMQRQTSDIMLAQDILTALELRLYRRSSKNEDRAERDAEDVWTDYTPGATTTAMEQQASRSDSVPRRSSITTLVGSPPLAGQEW